LGLDQGLLFGSDNGGRTAAALSRSIDTYKRLQMDPFAYIRDVFDRISVHPAPGRSLWAGKHLD